MKNAARSQFVDGQRAIGVPQDAGRGASAAKSRGIDPRGKKYTAISSSSQTAASNMVIKQTDNKIYLNAQA